MSSNKVVSKERSFFEVIKSHIIRNSGLYYYASRDSELENKLRKRLKALDIKNYRDYYTLLVSGSRGPVEFDALMTELTIGETFFFRNNYFFNALEKSILPELLKRKKGKSLRVWSAGCSTGEEVYSLAILLKEKFAAQRAQLKISITGTDINRDFISRAIKGVYSQWSFRNLDQALVDKYFVRKKKFYHLKEEMKQGINFEYHNMVKQSFPSIIYNLMAFDLILCRNVMIYFSQEINKRLMAQFRDSLQDDGWLIIGHVEHQPVYEEIMKPVALDKFVAYRKVPAVPASDARSPGNIFSSFPGTPAEEFFSGPPPAVSSPGEITVPELFFPRNNRLTEREGQARKIKKNIARGYWEEARLECEKLMLTNRLNPLYYFYSALIAEQKGEEDKAEKFLNQAIYLDRKYLLAHYHLGLLKQNRNEPRKAKKSFLNVLELLRQRKGDEVIEEFDGITVDQLKNLLNYNLEVLDAI